MSEEETRTLRPASDVLATLLRNMIVSGEIPVGSSLPSERDLMVMHKVSRTTVREALRILGTQGLVEVRRGRTGGSYARAPSQSVLVNSVDLFIQGQDIRFIDLILAREAIEPAAAAQAAISRTEEELAELEERCIECERTFGDIARFVEANYEWHLAVARASHNKLFVVFINAISSALRAATELEEFDERTRKAVVGVHWQIYHAILLRDPEQARRRMTRHVSAYGERLSSINLEELRSPAPDGAPRATGTA